MYAVLIALFFLPCAASAADTGFIAVASTPNGARIFVDDIYQATTPWKGIFPTGQHTLKLTYPGYQNSETAFVLHPLESKNFDIVMNPLATTGTIIVSSTPSEARVFIDDIMVGVTPWSGTAANGAHTVKVTKINYNDYGTTVTVEGGKTVTVTANLVPIQQTGSVSVFSTPTGATVFFDGVSYGAAPVTATLAPGLHAMKVSTTGYNDYVATVSVAAGQTLPVYVTLVSGTAIATTTTTPVVTSPVTTIITGTTTLTTTIAQTSGGKGSLLLSSRPPGANVYVDGTFIGKSPAGMRSVSAGPHTVLFTMNGFLDFSTIIQVTADQTTEFTATLEPAGPRGSEGVQTTKAPGFGLLLAVAGIAGYAIMRKRVG